MSADPNERPPVTVPGACAQRSRTRFVRWLWTAIGLGLLGLGGVGVFVPGLPSTVFFIGAAACFGRSHPRLERWVLGLPRIGPLVSDYRAGLGMPRRAKGLAVTAIMLAVGLSLLAIPHWLGKLGAVALALVGIWYILACVPTREHVLAQRSSPER
ncbi:MAG: YbaN family protein [Chloroflexota bacterium]|nr:YbaN family protein [Chloroflexota bacterium]